MNTSFSQVQEEEVKQLAEAMAEAAQEDFLKLARTLVGSASPFGQTEFTIRDIVLRVGGKAYEQYLAQKKTATKGPA